jgi:predicted ATPase
MAPHIEELVIQNHGCIGEATLQLTRLHALVGPNDSGKSTVLEAVRILAGATLVERLRKNRHEAPAVFEGRSGDEAYRVTFAKDALRVSSFVKGAEAPLDRAAAAFAGAQLFRLDADALRLPSSPLAEAIRFADERGRGLAAVYAALAARDLSAFMALTARIATRFPTVRALVTQETPAGLELAAQLHDGKLIAAPFLSDGLLYFLALATIPHLEGVAVVLLEEPERGLRSALIGELMADLRAASQRKQILLATHSPLVVQSLASDEVTVMTRASEGAVAVLPPLVDMSG